MAVVGWDVESKSTGFRDVPFAYEATGVLWNPLIVTSRPVAGRVSEVSILMIDLPPVAHDASRTPATAGSVTPAAPLTDGIETSTSTPSETEAAEVITATARLAFIREWLSLNISQLATALDVTRPTVYDWLSGERVPHADNALRIKQVYDLAREWEQMSSVPLRVSATTPIVDDKTLLSALSGPSPDVSLARAMLDRCSEEGAPTVRNEHDRALTKATIEDAERVARWLR